MNKEEILRLNDIEFLEWCKNISQCRCPQIRDDLTLNLVPLLRESVRKYYRSNETKNKIIKYGFMYDGNTCYMDSLFTTIFFNKKSSFYQNIINLSDNEIDRTLYNNFKVICSSNSKINTKPLIKEYAKKIRDQLKEDITKLNEGHTTTTCSMLRKHFKECLTDMTNSPYNIANLFSLIGDLFPKIKITYQTNKVITSSFINLSEFLGFNDIDFLPSINDHYVFYNDGVVRGHDLSQSGIVGEFYIENPLNFTIKIGDYDYELTGIIILEGVSLKTQEGGAHYVSYFSKKTGLKPLLPQWYFYNDIKDTDRIIKVGVDHIGSDKHHFFEEHNYSYPEMYFYTKKSFTIKIP